MKKKCSNGSKSRVKYFNFSPTLIPTEPLSSNVAQVEIDVKFVNSHYLKKLADWCNFDNSGHSFKLMMQFSTPLHFSSTLLLSSIFHIDVNCSSPHYIGANSKKPNFDFRSNEFGISTVTKPSGSRWIWAFGHRIKPAHKKNWELVSCHLSIGEVSHWVQFSFCLVHQQILSQFLI